MTSCGCGREGQMGSRPSAAVIYDQWVGVFVGVLVGVLVLGGHVGL